MTFRHDENPKELEHQINAPSPTIPIDSNKLLSEGLNNGVFSRIQPTNSLQDLIIASSTANRPVDLGDPNRRTQADLDFEKQTGSDRNSSK